jgi:hypothetical protein
MLRGLSAPLFAALAAVACTRSPTLTVDPAHDQYVEGRNPAPYVLVAIGYVVPGTETAVRRDLVPLWIGVVDVRGQER